MSTAELSHVLPEVAVRSAALTSAAIRDAHTARAHEAGISNAPRDERIQRLEALKKSTVSISLISHTETIDPITGEKTGQTVQVMKPQRYGSGFCISGGRIITNAHVGELVRATSDISHGGELIVEIAGPSARKIKVTKVTSDRFRDIAILELAEPHNQPEVALGSSDTVRQSDRLHSFGAPAGFRDTYRELMVNRVSTPGRVPLRYVESNGPGPFRERDEFIHVDGVMGGMSGGAIFNDDGEVVAIVVGAAEGRAGYVGWAIPINEVRAFVAYPDVLAEIKAGFDGLRVEHTKDMAKGTVKNSLQEFQTASRIAAKAIAKHSTTENRVEVTRVVMSDVFVQSLFVEMVNRAQARFEVAGKTLRGTDASVHDPKNLRNTYKQMFGVELMELIPQVPFEETNTD